MMEYFEIIERLDDPISDPTETMYSKIVVEDRDEAVYFLNMLKPKYVGKKYIAKYVISKHEEGLPCEEEILEEVTE